MSIVRWNPFREVEALNNEMNRLFSRFSGTTFSGMSRFNSEEEGNERSNNQNSNQWLLPMDVVETQDAIKLRTALPGINPVDVHIEINDNLLTVSAQRHDEERSEKGSYRWIEQQYGSFSRSVMLPRYVDTERIEADLNNGILELVIPKKESAKPRRVQLKTANNSSSSNQPIAIQAGDGSGPIEVDSKQSERQLVEATS